MVSDSRKKANQKWDAQNMCVLGCKVRKSDAEIFKLACSQHGTSPNEVFRKAMQEFIATHPVTDEV